MMTMLSLWENYCNTIYAEAHLRKLDMTPSEVLGYLIAGLCGEAEECWSEHCAWNSRSEPMDPDQVVVRLRAELGDALWYFGMIDRFARDTYSVQATWPDPALDIEFRTSSNALGHVRPVNLMGSACRVAEALKRPLRARPLDTRRTVAALSSCASSFVQVARHVGGLAAIMEENTAKYRRVYGIG